jgi:acyl-coenzyme A thioesterase PaaI-like protein
VSCPPPWSAESRTGGRSLPDLSDVIDRVQAAYGHACFACGRDNPIGMHLELLGVTAGWVEATFTPRPDFRGAPDVVHGGVTAAALDEIMVWAGIVMENVMTVTGRLDLRYRRPIHLGEAVLARGTVESRSGRRLAMTGAPGGCRAGGGRSERSLPRLHLGRRPPSSGSTRMSDRFPVRRSSSRRSASGSPTRWSRTRFPTWERPAPPGGGWCWPPSPCSLSPSPPRHGCGATARSGGCGCSERSLAGPGARTRFRLDHGCPGLADGGVGTDRNRRPRASHSRTMGGRGGRAGVRRGCVGGLGDRFGLDRGQVLALASALLFAGHLGHLTRTASRHVLVPFTGVQLLVAGLMAWPFHCSPEDRRCPRPHRFLRWSGADWSSVRPQCSARCGARVVSVRRTALGLTLGADRSRARWQ